MEIIRYHEFNFRILAASVMIEEREYLAAGIAVINSAIESNGCISRFTR